MSLGAVAIVRSDKPVPADKFSKSADGRTVFYPFGRSGIGFVVPDAECEKASRAALERARRGQMRLLSLLPPALIGAFFGFYMLFDNHPFLATGAVLSDSLSIHARRLARSPRPADRRGRQLLIGRPP
jgi:hypothetical protein